MDKPKVVVTGACGEMIGLVRAGLQERYDCVLLDTRARDRDGREVPGVQVLDLLAADRSRLRTICAGAYAVVHGAFVRAPRTESGPIQIDSGNPDERFAAELANVRMAYNVYQSAFEANARRVVVLSSNHAADYYERLILKGEADFVTPGMRALSDNYYGWAKEAYEHLGFVFAAGRVLGSPLPNVQIRIGGPRETDIDRVPPGDLVKMRRALAVYMSARDMLQLFVKSIETEDIADDHGVPFQIFYGISANACAFWSIANARRVIGYAPEDSSEQRFAEKIAAHLAAARTRGGEQDLARGGQG
jgi:hypothetical protein